MPCLLLNAAENVHYFIKKHCKNCHLWYIVSYKQQPLTKGFLLWM